MEVGVSWRCPQEWNEGVRSGQEGMVGEVVDRETQRAMAPILQQWFGI